MKNQTMSLWNNKITKKKILIYIKITKKNKNSHGQIRVDTKSPLFYKRKKLELIQVLVQTDLWINYASLIKLFPYFSFSSLYFLYLSVFSFLELCVPLCPNAQRKCLLKEKAFFFSLFFILLWSGVIFFDESFPQL
jgi:hypothetical protein